MCGPNASVGRGRSEGISAVEEGQRAGRSEVKKSTAASSSGAGTRSGGGGVEGVTSAGGKIAEGRVGRVKFWGGPGMCIEITEGDGGYERALEGERGHSVVGGGEVVRRGRRGEIN